MPPPLPSSAPGPRVRGYGRQRGYGGQRRTGTKVRGESGDTIEEEKEEMRLTSVTLRRKGL